MHVDGGDLRQLGRHRGQLGMERELAGLLCCRTSSKRRSTMPTTTGFSPDSLQNSTVSYNALATLLCPSDNQKQRPNYPWAPMNYSGNTGGPGVIRIWNGTIETPFTCSTTNQIPINGWGVGTCWWGADSNLAYFGLEGVTDGSSNTALFSEKLLGAAADDPSPTVGSPNARRGIYLDPPGMSIAYNSGSTGACLLRSVRACRSHGQGPLPSNTGWLTGFSWTMGYPWHTVVNRYTHYNTPNKLTCLTSGDTGGLWGGMDGIVTVSSNHPGGVNICFTDGSVRFVKDSVGHAKLVGDRHDGTGERSSVPTPTDDPSRLRGGVNWSL